MSGKHSQANRMAPLDGLRGFASLYVIVAHLFPLWRGRGIGERVGRTLLDLGWSGVDLFFVLSGFLITGILLKSKGDSARRYFGIFYARRFLRVFPVYYLMLVVLLVVVPRVPFFARWNYFWVVQGSGLPYWTYLSNWGEQVNAGTHWFLCVCWSLAIEEQYYVVWPLTVWFTSRRGLAIASIGLLGASAALRAGLFLGLGWPVERVFHMTFTHLDGIALGSLLAIAWRDRVRYGWILDRFAGLAVPLGAALLAVVLYAGLTRGEGAPLSYTPALIVGFPLVVLFYGSLLIRSLVRPGAVRAIFSTPFLRMLGKYSYAAYLFQFAAKWIVDLALAVAARRVPFVPPFTSPVGLFFKFVLQVTASYGLAALSWKVLEGPINAFKERTPLLNPASRPPAIAPSSVPPPPGSAPLSAG